MSLNKTPHRLRRQPLHAGDFHRKSTQQSIPVNTFYKSLSEPFLFPVTGDENDSGDGCRSPKSGEDSGWFGRFPTFNDVLSSSPEHTGSSLSRRNNLGYEKEAKVVITVTVEGSPGPIRTLVKLGTTVDDTIKLVVQKYVQEGRTPMLHHNAASSFYLHHSYFSLQCLDKSITIGNIGTRSFYLRKSDQMSHGDKPLEVATTSLSPSEVILHHENSPKQPSKPPMLILPPFITRMVGKIMQRMRKFLQLFGCLHSK